MAKVKGPLLSIAARGQIAHSQVYSSWRGVPYVRQHVTPANPRTAAQQSTRNVFTSIDDQYKHMGALARAPWDTVAKGRPLTGRNALMRDNIPVLRGQPDMTNFVASPGALGGLPLVNLAVAPTATAGELEFTVTSPQEPVDWTLFSVVVTAFLDRDPVTVMADFVVEDQDVAPVVDGDTIITLTGLDSAALYIASAWLVWTRPDGVTAYGTSITTTGTPL